MTLEARADEGPHLVERRRLCVVGGGNVVAPLSKVIDAPSDLTAIEAEGPFARSVVENQKVCSQIAARGPFQDGLRLHFCPCCWGPSPWIGLPQGR